MQAISFNTGRQYGADGQIVVAYVVSKTVDEFGLDDITARFVDLTRMVSGEIPFLTSFNPTAIMQAYDHGVYRNVFISDAEEAQAVEAAQYVGSHYF